MVDELALPPWERWTPESRQKVHFIDRYRIGTTRSLLDSSIHSPAVHRLPLTRLYSHSFIPIPASSAYMLLQFYRPYQRIQTKLKPSTKIKRYNSISFRLARAAIVTSQLVTILAGIDLCFGANMRKTFRPLFNPSIWSGNSSVNPSTVDEGIGYNRYPTIVTTVAQTIHHVVRCVIDLSHSCPANRHEAIDLVSLILLQARGIALATFISKLQSYLLFNYSQLCYNSFKPTSACKKQDFDFLPRQHHTAHLSHSNLSATLFSSFTTSPIRSGVYRFGSLISPSISGYQKRFYFGSVPTKPFGNSAQSDTESLTTSKALSDDGVHLDCTSDNELIKRVHNHLLVADVDPAIDILINHLKTFKHPSAAKPLISALLARLVTIHHSTTNRFLCALVIDWLYLLNQKTASAQAASAIVRSLDRNICIEFNQSCLLKLVSMPVDSTSVYISSILIDLLKKSLFSDPANTNAAQNYTQMLIRSSPDDSFQNIMRLLIQLCSKLNSSGKNRGHQVLQILLEPVLNHVSHLGERDRIVQILKLIGPSKYVFSLSLIQGIIVGLLKSKSPELVHDILNILDEAKCLQHVSVVIPLIQALLNQHLFLLAEQLYKEAHSMQFDAEDMLFITNIMSAHFLAIGDLTTITQEIDRLISQGRSISCHLLMIRRTELICKSHTPRDAFEELVRYKSMGVPVSSGSLTQIMNALYKNKQFSEVIEVFHSYSALGLSPDVVSCSILCKIFVLNQDKNGLDMLLGYMAEKGIKYDTMFYQQLLYFYQQFPCNKESFKFVEDLLFHQVPLYKAATRILLSWLVKNKEVHLALKVWQDGHRRMVYFDINSAKSLAALCMYHGLEDARRNVIVQFKESTYQKQASQQPAHFNYSYMQTEIAFDAHNDTRPSVKFFSTPDMENMIDS
ncbi:hypothetical protein BDV3_007127 [Batrachochytrium dendrobatidis]